MLALDLDALLAEPARRAGLEARALLAMVRAGALGVDLPHRVLRIAAALNDYGPFGGSVKIAAIRHGDHPAIVDERGEITYRQFDGAIDRLANALRDRMRPGETVGILCRNHRAPLLAAFGASRAGLNTVWLNAAFSARQAAEVTAREGVDLLVHDADLSDVVADLVPRHGKIVVDVSERGDDLDALLAYGEAKPPPRPPKPGRIVLLTSGTTGTPKGAPRPEPKGFVVPGGLLERMPMRAREVALISPPLFHGTGLLIALLAVALGCKLVLRTRFDAARVLADIEQHKINTICFVPIMLQRVLALGEDEIARHDTTSLRIVFCAGSQLPAAVATRAQDVFGEVIYNLYGSTEVALASMATPRDVREAPTSVGRPMLGSQIKILDEHGRPMPAGSTGRVFVGTGMPFEGYTGGGHKEIIDGLMSSGDVGHFDRDGRLYIDGRDDDMIVSGGENVFPREVEDLLMTHPSVADAAAIGVRDEEFGERLRAFVVARPGAEVTEDEVKAFVRDNLARYKVPREVVFLPELPRNPTGKVLKRELAAR